MPRAVKLFQKGEIFIEDNLLLGEQSIFFNSLSKLRREAKMLLPLEVYPFTLYHNGLSRCKFMMAQ